MSCATLLLCLLGSTASFGQNHQLLEKAEELIYSNPDEAIKISEHIVKSAEDEQTRAHINFILSKSYLVKGDFNNAAIPIFSNTEELPKVSPIAQFRNYLVRTELFRELYLDKQAKNYLSKAQEVVSNMKTESTVKDSLQSLIILEDIQMKIDRHENLNALQIIDETNEKFKAYFDSHSNEKLKITLAKEMVYKDLSLHDSAFTYINKTNLLFENSQQNNLYEKAIFYSELGNLYLQKNEFEKSEEILFMALKCAEVIDNPSLLMQINRDLAINYLATSQKSKYLVYNDKFLVLNNKVELMDQKSINTVYNLVTEEHNKVVLKEEKTYQNYRNIVIAIAFLVLLVGAFVLIKSELRKKRLHEIIKYLEISRAYFSKIKPTKRASKNKIMIPEETERGILIKLKKFENSRKYLNRDMSLAVLAGQFETNTKYLSEIINKHYNDNFNTFINKLRINYIINKLKKDNNYINYKISFLAEESGYSSHSSFATVFKSIVGMSPATFINLIKEEREALKSSTEES
ncbi:helix-turn-helix domain-containing protein [Pseudotamlana agarivorans]|uniref:helix-turn-helix domain-containing protein n=1 Tax=Pseudotamlana agarivorans TaxID=481183 RepID=UPI000832A1DB|nr:AraC family transcriptional regulator [Tamlana agarivorans]